MMILNSSSISVLLHLLDSIWSSWGLLKHPEPLLGFPGSTRGTKNTLRFDPWRCCSNCYRGDKLPINIQNKQEHLGTETAQRHGETKGE